MGSLQSACKCDNALFRLMPILWVGLPWNLDKESTGHTVWLFHQDLRQGCATRKVDQGSGITKRKKTEGKMLAWSEHFLGPNCAEKKNLSSRLLVHFVFVSLSVSTGKIKSLSLHIHCLHWNFLTMAIFHHSLCSVRRRPPEWTFHIHTGRNLGGMGDVYLNAIGRAPMRLGSWCLSDASLSTCWSVHSPVEKKAVTLMNPVLLCLLSCFCLLFCEHSDTIFHVFVLVGAVDRGPPMKI